MGGLRNGVGVPTPLLVAGLKIVTTVLQTGNGKNGTLTLGKSPDGEDDLSPKELNQMTGVKYIGMDVQGGYHSAVHCRLTRRPASHLGRRDLGRLALRFAQSARRPDRCLQQQLPRAVHHGNRDRFFVRFCPGLPIAPSSASQTLLLLRGSRGIHRSKRRGVA